ncbi:MAG: double zinc ribbon domain-containing protein [Treponema sp.]|jgi:ComF family protein|nr:double zinc ribbon domain-containing protein [Treponema sp.]
MNSFSPCLSLLREYVFPSGCASCGNTLTGKEEAWYGLCKECMPRFEIEEGPRCASCGRPLISEQGDCLPCREREGFAFDKALVLWPYRGRYQKILKAYKFNQFLALGNFFTLKMVQALSYFQLKETSWVPVPPRPGKIRSQGWDQVDYLAKRLELTQAQRLSRCLVRLPSKSQKKLDRAGRRLNLLGRILCKKPPPERVVLFDDVLTTGSTLDVSAAALKAQGAKEVYALALFYD